MNGLTARELSCLLAVRIIASGGERPTHSKIAARLNAASRRTSGKLIESLSRKGFVARDANGLLFETGARLP